MGMSDPHWIVEKVQGSSQFVNGTASKVMNDTVFPVVGAYENEGFSQSKWISFTTDGYCNSDDIFKFTQRFYLDPGSYGNLGVPDSSLQLTGQFSSDNASEMYLNGNLVGGLPYYEPIQGYSWQAHQQFDLRSGFVSGWNEISYLVGSASTMGGHEGPVVEWMALRVEGSFEAVPEPATFALIGLGLVGVIKRKKR